MRTEAEILQELDRTLRRSTVLARFTTASLGAAACLFVGIVLVFVLILGYVEVLQFIGKGD